MKSERFQKTLENKFENLDKDRDKHIREKVARLVFGASIVRVFKPGMKEKLIPKLAKIKIEDLKKRKQERIFKKWFQKESRKIAKIIKGDKKKRINVYAHAPKILALYCRALFNENCKALSKQEYKRIEKLLFVPIDSYVIRALRNLEGYGKIKGLKNIKSMADFKRGTFMNIQEILKGASQKTRIPRIVFDYVWGEEIKQVQTK